jgi:hypothetical protein
MCRSQVQGAQKSNFVYEVVIYAAKSGIKKWLFLQQSRLHCGQGAAIVHLSTSIIGEEQPARVADRSVSRA